MLFCNLYMAYLKVSEAGYNCLCILSHQIVGSERLDSATLVECVYSEVIYRPEVVNSEFLV